MEKFNYQTRLELYETDASGVIFYSKLFYLVHRTFSAFLNHHKVSIQERFVKQDFMFPVVHAEGDFLAPMHENDVIDIELNLLKLGTSSFTLGYTLKRESQCVAQAKIVHVCVGKDKQKIAIPDSFKQKVFKVSC
ncbi:MAG: 1,4-dihydroxy-2-naphthoyl-CoA hydrolase [Chlamydiae bacterium]|nr:1,4-dihydroxy-2-naphthoyl-CoA hydrolase [Chlamydiota bacterium]